MLRMFNDCIAVLCGYIAVLLFTRKNWRVGCLVYSLGVSVKMNMLLYAPGVLLALLLGTGYTETFICLSICAAVQVVLGLPFLTTYPVQYLMKAFELNRVFTYKWTVNFKFLPEEVFVSKPLSLLLLALTVLGIVAFAAKWVQEVSMSR
jgi:alpha-1,3-mannosyltransferase